MAVHELAGKPVRSYPHKLVDLAKLEAEYHRPSAALRPVNFATAGHRGSPFTGGYTDAHVMAVTKAVIDYRNEHDITGPVLLTRDTNHCSGMAFRTSMEVLAAHNVTTLVAQGLGYTATPVASLNIVKMNRGAVNGRVVSGLIHSPSHNPPDEGGTKFNPPYGGPIGAVARSWVNERANQYLSSGNQGIRRMPFERAIKLATEQDFDGAYIDNLGQVIDMEAIRASKLRMGMHPLGGAALACLERIIERYGIDLTIVDKTIDPRFGFMTFDHDGKIRMDPSSQYATIALANIAHLYDYAWASDPDVDRNCKARRQGGVMNPNYSSSVAVDYLLTHRPNWPKDLRIGYTSVSSNMLAFVARAHGRELDETPVGWQWLAPGLFQRKNGYGMEESSGESLLDMYGYPASTDKDGIAGGLLGAEIMAVTGSHPEELYAALTRTHGEPFYKRSDMRFATPEALAPFDRLVPADITAGEIAGLPVTAIMDRAPGNNAPLGGLKIVLGEGVAWFAIRRSGTEFTVLKVYYETFKGEEHLAQLSSEVEGIVRQALAK